MRSVVFVFLSALNNSANPIVSSTLFDELVFNQECFYLFPQLTSIVYILLIIEEGSRIDTSIFKGKDLNRYVNQSFLSLE